MEEWNRVDVTCGANHHVLHDHEMDQGSGSGFEASGLPCRRPTRKRGRRVGLSVDFDEQRIE